MSGLGREGFPRAARMAAVRCWESTPSTPTSRRGRVGISLFLPLRQAIDSRAERACGVMGEIGRRIWEGKQAFFSGVISFIHQVTPLSSLPIGAILLANQNQNRYAC